MDHDDWTAPRFATAGGTISPVIVTVCSILAEVLYVDRASVRPPALLTEDLGMDELSRVALTYRLEVEFGINILEVEAWRWTTAGDVAFDVRERVMRRAAA